MLEVFGGREADESRDKCDQRQVVYAKTFVIIYTFNVYILTDKL